MSVVFGCNGTKHVVSTHTLVASFVYDFKPWEPYIQITSAKSMPPTAYKIHWAFSLNGSSTEPCAVLLIYATHALAHFLGIWWKVSHHDSGSTSHIFSHISADLDLQLFLKSALYALLPYNIPLYVVWGQSVLSLSYSLITSCIRILNHPKNSRSSVFVSLYANTIFTPGFPKDLNSDVVLVTVPFKHSLLNSLGDWNPCHLWPDNEPTVTEIFSSQQFDPKSSMSKMLRCEFPLAG